MGPFITSHDMAGASVTLLKVHDELLGLWDAPVRTPALRWESEMADCFTAAALDIGIDSVPAGEAP